MLLCVIALYLLKPGILQKLTLLSILAMLVIYFALLSIISIISGEVWLKGFNITKKEKPFLYYLVVITFGAAAVVVLLGFVKIAMEVAR